MRNRPKRRLSPLLLAGSLCFMPALAGADNGGASCPAHPAGIQQAGKLASVWFQKGKTHVAAGRHAQALAAFRCAHRFVPSLGTRYWIGRCAEALGRYRVALAAYQAVYMNPPKGINAGRLILRIRSLAARVKAVARADADIPCPAHPAGIQQASTLASAWFQKGKAHVSAGKHKEAFAAFMCAHRFVPSLRTRYWIGRCAEALAMYRVALASYRAVYMNPPKGINAAELILRIRNLARIVDALAPRPVRPRAARPPRAAAARPPAARPAHKRPPRIVKRAVRLPRPPHLAPVEGGAVLQYIWRWFDIAPDTSSTGPNPYYRWRPGIPGSAGLWAEVFPGAFFTDHIVGANVGAGIWWARSFPFFSHVRRTHSEDFDTVYQQLDLYATYRWAWLLRGRDRPVLKLKLDLGIGNFRFLFDVPEAMDPVVRDRVKSGGVNFWYFKFRVGAKVPILPDRLWATTLLGFMFPFSSGPVAEWWTYGDAATWGLEARLEVTVRMFWRLHGTAYCQYTGFWIDFKGSDRTFVADKAEDRYAVWGLTVHVKY